LGEGRGEGKLSTNPPASRFQTMHPKSRLQTLRTPRAAADAKWLRRGMTDCEYRLWYYLRARRFQDRKFRRQVPM